MPTLAYIEDKLPIRLALPKKCWVVRRLKILACAWPGKLLWTHGTSPPGR